MAESQVLPALDATLSDVVLKLKELTELHGEQGLELIGRVYQLEAIYYLIVFPVFVVITLIITFIFAYYLKKAFESDGYIPCALFSGIALILSSLGGFVFLIKYFINPVVWISAQDPYVAIAASILGKM